MCYAGTEADELLRDPTVRKSGFSQSLKEYIQASNFTGVSVR